TPLSIRKPAISPHRSCRTRPVPSTLSTPTRCVGCGCSASGRRRASARSPEGNRRTTSSRTMCGLAWVTQISPSLPVAMLSGYPARLSNRTSCSPCRAPVSRTRRTRRLPVSATATQDSSAVSATPLANCKPRARVSTVPSGARRNSLPVPVCSIRSERHCSTGNRLDESLKYIVPSAATAALLHTTNGAPSPERVSVRTAPEATSTVSSPRSESHTTSPSSPYNSIPSGLPPVSAIVSIRVPSPETRMILPFSSPVNTQPSASTTTSSGPLPLIGSNDTEPNRTRTTPLATTSQLRQLGTQRDERDPN